MQNPGPVRLGTGSRLRHTLVAGDAMPAAFSPDEKPRSAGRSPIFAVGCTTAQGGVTVREVAAAVVLAHAGETAAF